MPQVVEGDLAFAHDLADETVRVARDAFVLGRVIEHGVKEDGGPSARRTGRLRRRCWSSPAWSP